jgi:hypothetical protein
MSANICSVRHTVDGLGNTVYAHICEFDIEPSLVGLLHLTEDNLRCAELFLWQSRRWPQCDPE